MAETFKPQNSQIYKATSGGLHTDRQICNHSPQTR